MLHPTRKTVSDYLAYDGDERIELIDGEFVVSPGASFRHQLISIRLATSLRSQVLKLALGEILTAPYDAILSPRDAVQPDIVFLSTETLKRADPSLKGPPDVAVEVISKGHRSRDTRKKRGLYHRFRVPEYWIVDPEAKTITVLVWNETGWLEHGVFKRGESATSVVMRGVVASLDEIFE